MASCTLTCHGHKHRRIGQIALGQDRQHLIANVGLIEFFVNFVYAQDHLLLDLKRMEKKCLN